VNILGIAKASVAPSTGWSLTTGLLSAGTHKIHAFTPAKAPCAAGLSNSVTTVVTAVGANLYTIATLPTSIVNSNSIAVADFNGDGNRHSPGQR
jgi:hypothetical protein